jgi:hypothetical protein
MKRSIPGMSPVDGHNSIYELVVVAREDVNRAPTAKRRRSSSERHGRPSCRRVDKRSASTTPSDTSIHSPQAAIAMQQVSIYLF